jgi:hypothetical protein
MGLGAETPTIPLLSLWHPAQDLTQASNIKKYLISWCDFLWKNSFSLHFMKKGNDTVQSPVLQIRRPLIYIGCVSSVVSRQSRAENMPWSPSCDPELTTFPSFSPKSLLLGKASKQHSERF